MPIIDFSAEGVHGGMRFEDVRRTPLFTSRSVRVVRTPCLAEYVAMGKRRVPMDGDGRCIQNVTAYDHRPTLTLYLIAFVEDLPAHPGVSIVSEIARDDLMFGDAEIARLESRYGSPTTTDGTEPWTVAFWCSSRCRLSDGFPLPTENAPARLLVHRGVGYTFSDYPVAAPRLRERSRALKAHDITLMP